ncbi:hypothetical protein GF314_11315 [bacterium]|nr:hypothetical protein [bacterium]
MRRVVGPEILDSLPADHPAAVANRRDLRRINALQGNPRWIARTLAPRLRPGDEVLEAGAGDGTLGRELWRRLPVLRRCRYTGLDRQTTRPDGWPGTWDWIGADLLDHPLAPSPRVVVISFLLHQFDDDQLADLGRRLAPAEFWVVCEPHRSGHALMGLGLLRPLLGLHRVSWQDGRTSIRGGFRGQELPALLGAGAAGRTTRVTIDPRGVYRMVSVAPRDRSTRPGGDQPHRTGRWARGRSSDETP